MRSPGAPIFTGGVRGVKRSHPRFTCKKKKKKMCTFLRTLKKRKYHKDGCRCGDNLWPLDTPQMANAQTAIAGAIIIAVLIIMMARPATASDICGLLTTSPWGSTTIIPFYRGGKADSGSLGDLLPFTHLRTGGAGFPPQPELPLPYTNAVSSSLPPSSRGASLKRLARRKTAYLEDVFFRPTKSVHLKLSGHICGMSTLQEDASRIVSMEPGVGGAGALCPQLKDGP